MGACASKSTVATPQDVEVTTITMPSPNVSSDGRASQITSPAAAQDGEGNDKAKRATSIGRNCAFGFDIRRVEGLSIAVAEFHANHTTLPFEMLGPAEAVGQLDRKTRSSSMISPMAAVTIPADHRESVGIPEAADFFAFAHPLDLEGVGFDELVAVRAPICAPAVKPSANSAPCPPGRPARQAAMVVDDVTGEAASAAWLDFVLVGGYCYFDASHRFLAGNALSAGDGNSRSIGRLNLQGPIVLRKEAGYALRDEGRMARVTVPALTEIGFTAFAWVNPNESPGGQPLGLRDGITIENGGFAYEAPGRDQWFVYRMALPGDAALADARASGIKSDALDMALDTALRGSLAALATALKRGGRRAHKHVRRRVTQLREQTAQQLRSLHSLKWLKGKGAEEVADATMLLQATVRGRQARRRFAAAPKVEWAELDLGSKSETGELPVKKVKMVGQAGGHPGSFEAEADGTLRKETSAQEANFYRLVQGSALASVFPAFYGSEPVEPAPGELIDNRMVRMRMQDLTAGCTRPCVMDIKMGVRTFAESEVASKKLRADLVEKMLKLAPAEVSDAERAAGVTKLRYMQFREHLSSTHDFGWRIEAIVLPNADKMDTKLLKTREQLLESFGRYVQGRAPLRTVLGARLKAIREALLGCALFFTLEMHAWMALPSDPV